jgi:hypothetical protein
VEGGRWKVEGGRWKVEGGRWKVEGWKVCMGINPNSILPIFKILSPIIFNYV